MSIPQNESREHREWMQRWLQTQARENKQHREAMERSQEQFFARQDQLFERQDRFLERQEQLFERQEQFCERQEQFCERQEQFCERQDRFLERQDRFLATFQKSVQESIEYGRRRMDDLARSLKATNDRLERQGFVQGEIAEDLFRRNLPSLLSGYGITEEQVYRNAHMPGRRQYDLVAVNGSLVFVFEVKNKLRENDIKRFCDLQLPDFKRVFPIYRDHTVYGGIGALVVKDEMQTQAEKRGLFVLTQGENDSAKLHEPKRPRVL